jgi:hypothetical protein
MKDASLYMLRACGIPAVCHYYLYMSADSGVSFTLDIGQPLLLRRIELTPRTDDNFIYPGDVYETRGQEEQVFYMKGGRQIFSGKSG